MMDSLAWSALVMGLVGGSHCLVMCAAPCAVLTGWPAEKAGGPRVIALVDERAKVAPQRAAWARVALFHLGRGAGYALLGGLAALAMDALAWTTSQATALRPLWTFAHVLILAWGVLMLLQARQPVWVEQAGRRVWQALEPKTRGKAGLLGAGVLWSLMPCGVLYSALLVAALGNSAWQGALTMLMFAAGSSLWLLAGPFGWVQLRQRLARHRVEWGGRVAGGLLCGVALWALWLEWIYKPSLWCR